MWNTADFAEVHPDVEVVLERLLVEPLRLERDGEMESRHRVVGILLDDGAEHLRRLAETSHVLVAHPEAQHRLEVLRITLHLVAPPAHVRILETGFREHELEVLPREVELRIDLERFLELLHRLLAHPLAEVDHAEVVERAGIVPLDA